MVTEADVFDLCCMAVKNILTGLLLQAQTLSTSNSTQGVHTLGCEVRRWEGARGKKKDFQASHLIYAPISTVRRGLAVWGKSPSPPLGQKASVTTGSTSVGTGFTQGNIPARHLPRQGFTHPQGLIYKVPCSGSFAFSKGCRNLIAL